MKCHKCGKLGHKGIGCFSRKKDPSKKNKVRLLEEKSADKEDLSEPEKCRAVNSSKEVLFS